MRLILSLALGLTLASTTAIAANKSKTKSITKICKEENPGASRKAIKKCIKDKMKADATQ